MSLPQIESALQGSVTYEQESKLVAQIIHIFENKKTNPDRDEEDAPVFPSSTGFTKTDSMVMSTIGGLSKSSHQDGKIQSFIHDNKLALYSLFFKLLALNREQEIEGVSNSDLDYSYGYYLSWILDNYQNSEAERFFESQMQFYQSLRPDDFRRKQLLEAYCAEVFATSASDFKRRERLLGVGLTLVRALGDERRLAALLPSLQFRLQQLGYANAGLALGDFIIAKSREIGAELWQAKAYSNNGYIYVNEADYEKAVNSYRQALQIYSSYNHKRNQQFIYERLAVSYILMGDFAWAEECLQAFNRISNTFRPEQETLYWMIQGLLRQELGEYEQARKSFEKSHSLAIAWDDKLNEGIALANLGHNYQAIGELELSLDNHTKALKVARVEGSPSFVTEKYLNLIEICAATGTFDRAQAYADTASRKLREFSFGRLRQKSQLKIGRFWLELARYEDAEKTLAEALAGFEEVHDLTGQIDALNLLGEIYRKQGNFRKAHQVLMKAKGLGKTSGRRSSYWQTLFSSARVLASQGRIDEAESHFRQAIAEIAAIQEDLKRESDKASFLQNIQPVFEEMVLLQLRMGNERAAFAYSEQGRAQVLKVLLSAAAGNDSSASQRTDEAAPDLVAAVQAGLDTDSRALHYEVTEDSLVVWVISKDKFETEVLPTSRAEIEKLVADFKGQVSVDSIRILSRADVSYERIRTILADLHGKLVAPLLRHLGAQQLFIVADEALHHLPFAALIDSSGQFLIKKYAIAYAQSSEILARDLLHMGRPANTSVLAVAGPDQSVAAAAVETVAGLYPQRRAVLPDQATKANVLRLLEDAPEVILFAVHAAADVTRPGNSHLQLTPVAGDSLSGATGFLRALHIRELNLQPTDLVYLSACESATGRLYRGEGIISLQRSLRVAGSNSVIANLWVVEEKKTRDVTVGFFQLWSKGGLSKSTALRQAQLATIDSLEKDPLFMPHPYFWAAPVLTGVPN